MRVNLRAVMQKVDVQSLNECFNVSGSNLIEDDWDNIDDKFISSWASKAGKISAELAKENKHGWYSIEREDRVKNGRKGGLISGNNNKINGTGFCGRTKEKMSEDGKKSGKVGGKVSGKLQYQNKIGIHRLSKEEIRQNASKGGKILSSQRWKCLVTGHISTPGALSNYQKARGIDISQRVRVE